MCMIFNTMIRSNTKNVQYNYIQSQIVLNLQKKDTAGEAVKANVRANSFSRPKFHPVLEPLPELLEAAAS